VTNAPAAPAAGSTLSACSAEELQLALQEACCKELQDTKQLKAALAEESKQRATYQDEVARLASLNSDLHQALEKFQINMQDEVGDIGAQQSLGLA
jgi:Holliday junction resolvasome RuvABC ATP-dependent DNA helicase subunit